MALYPISTSAQMEPLEVQESNRDIMLSCTHCGACEHAYLMLHEGMAEDWEKVADRLECADCEEWDG